MIKPGDLVRLFAPMRASLTRTPGDMPPKDWDHAGNWVICTMYSGSTALVVASMAKVGTVGDELLLVVAAPSGAPQVGWAYTTHFEKVTGT